MLTNYLNRSKGGTFTLISVLVFYLLSFLIFPIVVHFYFPTEVDYIENTKFSIRNDLTSLINNKRDSFNENVNSFNSSIFNEKPYKSNHDFIKQINLTSDKYPELSIEIIDDYSQNLIAWRNITDKSSDEIIDFNLKGLKFFKNQFGLYFYEIKNISINNQKLLIVYYQLFNKFGRNEEDDIIVREIRENYGISSKAYYNNEFIPENPNNTLITLFDGQITIELNNLNINTALERVESTISNLRIILLLILFIIFISKLIFWVKRFNKDINKPIYIIPILVLVRYAFLQIQFPDYLLSYDILNPVLYSSQIGWGLLKSPLDLFITGVFVLIISIYIYFYGYENKFIFKKTKVNKYVKLSGIIVTLIVVYLVWGKIVNSIILDSTLKYFRVNDLLPSFNVIFMLVIMLILGASFLLICISLLLYTYKAFDFELTYKKNIFAIAILTGIIILIDIIPAIEFTSVSTKVVLLIEFFSLVYLYIYKDYNKFGLLLLCFFAGSILMIFEAGYINTKSEKDKLKIVGMEYTRVDENWIEFLIRDNLINAVSDLDKIKNINSIDLKEKAYDLWNNSKIKSENLVSEFYFLDSMKNYIDGVNFSFPYGYSKNWTLTESFDGIKIVTDKIPGGNDYIISGLNKVSDSLNLYFGVSVKYNPYSDNRADVPQFMRFDSENLNAIDYTDYEIFTIIGNSIIERQANINPTLEELNFILSDSKYNNEYWKLALIDNVEYQFYILKNTNENESKTLIIGYKASDLSWNIYDFVKIFLIHVLIIFLMVFIYHFTKIIKVRNINLNYRTQILTTFLIITIIPLIVLAFYFRDTNNQKLINSIKLSLRNDVYKTADYLQKYSYYSETDLRDIIIKANNDLGLNFTLYKNEKVQYSTYYDYYYFGDISKFINLNVYQRIILEKSDEHFFVYKINDSKIRAFYKKIKLPTGEYVIEVNDAFNSAYITLDTTETDLFLFGTYTFVIIIIILLSIILTKKISYPIVRLTEMTKRVSNGDLSVQLKIKERGEVALLIDGFNKMVMELKRIQEELSFKERENAWKEMAKQVAHEIKNPLTPMKLSVQLLQQAYNDKSPRFDEIFDKVITTVINQIEILKNIASEFSLVAKQPELRIESIDLSFVLQDVIKLYSGDNIKIQVNCNSAGNIKSDAEQIKRIFINMIKNSIEASATEINIDISENNSKVELVFIDNGEGILPDIQKKIFNNKFTTKNEGMGIGLFMVKNTLISLNSGIELVESKKGQTIFKFNFPMG